MSLHGDLKRRNLTGLSADPSSYPKSESNASRSGFRSHVDSRETEMRSGEEQKGVIRVDLCKPSLVSRA